MVIAEQQLNNHMSLRFANNTLVCLCLHASIRLMHNLVDANKIAHGHSRVWPHAIAWGHNHVWTQSCIGTIESMHSQLVVWAQSCIIATYPTKFTSLSWYEMYVGLICISCFSISIFFVISKVILAWKAHGQKAYISKYDVRLPKFPFHE